VDQIEFRSDNAAGVAPEILAAIGDANAGTALAYGADELTESLEQVVREVFEHPTARVFPVTSGTAANALSLAALCPPWGSVLCHDTAHILQSECGATSMFGGGAVMRGVPGHDFRMQPDTLHAALDAVRWGDPHHSQPAVLSLTQPTDMGTIYSLDEIAALTAIARNRGLRVHVDGARIANAVVALGCSVADVTWRAGVDIISLGATKNGALSTEAIVAFDDRAADELVYRTKRSGHVTSKMRYQSAQLHAYLSDGLWLRLAAHSNGQMARLASGLATMGVEFVNRPDVNMLFARVSETVATELERSGLLFYRMPGSIRLVTSWQTSEADVDEALERFRSAHTSRRTKVEVFAEITCPFAYVGLQHVLEHIAEIDEPVDVIVRAWPLEWVNGTGLAFDGVETKAATLCEQLGVDDFASLRADRWPTTTIPALALQAAAYDVDSATGLAVALALRTALFEDGVDVSRADELARIASDHGVDFDFDDDSAVRADHESGQARGVIGSPHYFVGDDDFFCPALDLSRDSDDHLIARFDPSGLGRFLERIAR